MNSRSKPILTFSAIALLSGLGGLSAEDWPQWRGPKHNGISAESGLNWQELAKPKAKWTAKTGQGFSSVTVSDGRVYTMGLVGKEETVFCLDATTGKQLWKHSWPTDYKPQYYEGGTHATPTIDGDTVYVFGQSADLVAMEAKTGKVLWQKQLKKELSLRQPTWGFTGAPLVLADRLILNAGEHGVAVSKKDGKVLWQSGDEEPGYATPLSIKGVDGSAQVLIFGEEKLYSVDPQSGKKSWDLKWKTQYDVNASDPIDLGNGKLFVSSGYGHGGGVVSVSNAGASIVWENKKLKSQMNAPVFIDGHLYGFDGNTDVGDGFVCLDPETGTEKWRQKDLPIGGLAATKDTLIILAGKGELAIAKATSEKFTPIVRSQVITGKCWTVPTLAQGVLYVRNWAGEVIAYEVK